MKRINKVLIVHSLLLKNVEDAVKQVQEILKKYNVAFENYILPQQEFHANSCLISKEVEGAYDCDLIISVGGDGTFLSTARHFLLHGLPIIGVNAGHLGFLMEISPSELEHALGKVIKGNYHISERMVLDVRVFREKKEIACFHAFNDAVVSRAAVCRMIELSLSVGDEIMSHYRADGTIISTPSGSTAYNLSAGGPVLSPDLDVMVITPISPHTLGVRPVVVKGDQRIEIEVLTSIDNTVLTIDGQEGTTLKKGDIIKISSSEYKISLYRLRKTGFVAILREKLGWHT